MLLCRAAAYCSIYQVPGHVPIRRSTAKMQGTLVPPFLVLE